MKLSSTLSTLATASLFTTLASAQISFQGATNHPLVGLRPDGVAVGDFDRDADVDFAVVSSHLSGTNGLDRVEVFVNQGNGTFAPGQVLQVGVNVDAAALVAADFDRDGDLDLAVTLKSSSTLLVLVNNGGTFAIGGSTAIGGVEPASMRAADLDGDGDVDVVVSNRDSNTLSRMINGGTGTFTLGGTIATGVEPRDLALEDFNGDGRTDIAVAAHDDRRVEVRLNQGAGAFGAAVNYVVPGNEKPSGMVAADLEGDGDVDLVSTTDNNGIGLVTVLTNQGAGTFTLANHLSNGVNPSALVAGDFDGDGDKDVVAGDSNAASISAVANLGGTSFGLAATFSTGLHPEGVATSDFNGDGSLDVVSANRDSNTVSVLLNATISGTETYCSTSPNSATFGARIDSRGSLSMGTNTFTLLARNANASTTGVYFYGRSTAFAVFGNGLRCVGTPVYRLGPAITTDATGRAVRPVDFNAAPMASGTSQVFAGSSIYVQFWYRNPAGGGAEFNTSDALRATFRP